MVNSCTKFISYTTRYKKIAPEKSVILRQQINEYQAINSVTDFIICHLLTSHIINDLHGHRINRFSPMISSTLGQQDKKPLFIGDVGFGNFFLQPGLTGIDVLNAIIDKNANRTGRKSGK